jgi:hypothetical protein
VASWGPGVIGVPCAVGLPGQRAKGLAACGAGKRERLRSGLKLARGKGAHSALSATARIVWIA